MRKQRIHLLLLIFSFAIIYQNIADAEGTGTQFGDVSSSVKMLTDIFYKEYPSGYLLSPLYEWPTDETIQAKIIPFSDVSTWVRDQIGGWIKRVIKEKYIPPDSQKRIILIKNEINGYDFARLKYTVNDKYVVHISQNINVIYIGVRPLTTVEKATTLFEAKNYIQRIVEDLFNEEDKIKEITLKNLQDVPQGFQARSNPPNLIWWWGQMSIFSDGLGVCFTIGKGYGGKVESFDIKEWFKIEGFGASGPQFKGQ